MGVGGGGGGGGGGACHTFRGGDPPRGVAKRRGKS